jgi:membrane dipeptidase
MENADPIREPSEVGWWKERGLVAVGLTWSRASRYAGGNATTLGLTDEGRALVRELTRQRVLLDVSHLSDRAFDDLLEATDRPVMASHSNSRAVLTSTPEFRNAFSNLPSGLPPEVLLQRHLTDDQIRRIIERGGVIGLNLYKPFIDPALAKGQRPSVAQALAHVRHICRIAESVPSVADPRWHVGLGSDMDGGFSAEGLPNGINGPRDLVQLIEALAADGWSDGDLFNFACGNWVRLLNRVL